MAIFPPFPSGGSGVTGSVGDVGDAGVTFPAPFNDTNSDILAIRRDQLTFLHMRTIFGKEYAIFRFRTILDKNIKTLVVVDDDYNKKTFLRTSMLVKQGLFSIRKEFAEFFVPNWDANILIEHEGEKESEEL
jgi:hypothetical protein